MAKRNWFAYTLAFCVTGGFAAGLVGPDNIKAYSFQLPEMISRNRPGVNGHELEPLNAYSKTLGLLREKYHGELPSDLKLTHSAIRGMLKTLDDPYTRFLDPEEFRAMREETGGTFVGIGAQLENEPTKDGFVRINRPLPNTPAAKAGVKRGDMITKVDGKSVVGLTVDKVVKMIRGEEGTPVRLTIKRGEAAPFEVTIVRKAVEFEIVESNIIPNTNVGYVSLAQFNELADVKVAAAIKALERQGQQNDPAKGLQGLVLDLRGNPGGMLDVAIDLCSRFVPERGPVVVIVEGQGREEPRMNKPNLYLKPKYPVVCLINRTSASASEILAGCLQDYKVATLVGTTTFGKGLVQTVLPLDNGTQGAVMITTSKYLTAKGHDINRTRTSRGGVEPDVPVEITEEDFLKNRDTQLDKALEVIRTKNGGVAAR